MNEPVSNSRIITELTVQNVKCNGCVNTIKNGLLQDTRIQQVEVDIPTGKVTVISQVDMRSVIQATLQTLGFPEKPR